MCKFIQTLCKGARLVRPPKKTLLKVCFSKRNWHLCLGRKDNTTNLEMTKSTRGTGDWHWCTTGSSSRWELPVVGAVRRPVSPAASAKKMWFAVAEKERKSSGVWAKNPAKKVPPISTIDTSPGRAWHVSIEKWSVFPAENSLKKCSASWQWGWCYRKQLKRSKLTWREKVCCKWSWPS